MRHARSRFRPFFRGRLHRRIFAWFGISIFLTGVAVSLGWRLVRPDESFGPDVDGARRFLAGQLARSWREPRERDQIAMAMARDLSLGVRLEDTEQHTLAAFGGACGSGALVPPVVDGGQTLGSLAFCLPEHHRHGPYFLFPLLVAMAVIWGSSGVI